MVEQLKEEKTEIFAKREEMRLKPPYFVIVDGPHLGARFPLQLPENLMGRLEECQVVLDDQSVSRKHAVLKESEGRWLLEDLGSKNGSFVNGAKIAEPVVVGHKDLVRVGIYTLRLITQEISEQEEMDIPPQKIEEWGTVMTGPRQDGETARLGTASAEEQIANKEITEPHSPLEEEESKIRKPFTKKRFLKPRIWVLSSILFFVALGTGLYFYWEYVLAPGKEPPAPPPIAEGPSEPKAIPLGPPVPERPSTVPVFLDCVGSPLPAVVFFEGKEIGKTPLKVNVDLIPQKKYEIEGRFEMVELQEKYVDRIQFSVRADQSTIPLLFRAPVGTIKILNLPRDASLYLEGYFAYNKFQAKPVKLQNIVLNKPIFSPYGRYILELRQFKEVGTPGNLVEDIVYRREFNLEEENPAFVVEVTAESLKQFPAFVSSKPSGAQIFIDQRKLGVTPFEGLLPLGKHTLTLRKEGYFEENQTMEADINMPFKTEIVLRTTEAGEKINAGKTFLNKGLYQEALQVFSDVFNRNPTPFEIAETRYLLGKVYFQLGDMTKSLGYFDQAKENEMYKYWGQLGRATIFARESQVSEALLPLIDVLLNAKEEEVLKEAKGLLREISPLRSVVYIQSDPPGADVYLNNQKIDQTTPVLLHEMSLGTYKIRLEKKGFQALELSIQLSVAEFNPVLAKLKPIVE